MRSSDMSTRDELKERVETSREDMEKKEVDLDRIVSDLETARRTIEQLDFGGTKEGVEELEKAIERAEDVTVEVFGQEDEELERIQSDNKEFEGEVQDSHNSSESDLQKVSDVSAGIETQETANELEKAKTTILEDMDFLSEQIRRARDSRENSDAIQERHKERVEKGRRQ